MNTDIFLYQQYAGDDYAAQEQRGGGDKQLAESVFHGDADERPDENGGKWDIRMVETYMKRKCRSDSEHDDRP